MNLILTLAILLFVIYYNIWKFCKLYHKWIYFKVKAHSNIRKTKILYLFLGDILQLFAGALLQVQAYFYYDEQIIKIILFLLRISIKMLHNIADLFATYYWDKNLSELCSSLIFSPSARGCKGWEYGDLAFKIWFISCHESPHSLMNLRFTRSIWLIYNGTAILHTVQCTLYT